VSQLDSRLLVRLASVSAGRPAGWPLTAADGADERTQQLALEHGLLPLVDYRLQQSEVDTQVPQSLADLARDSARKQLMIDAITGDEIKTITSALAAADVNCVLLKGVALAWSLYPESWTRPRQDTDALILRENLPEARDVLRTLGYVQTDAMQGQSVFQQESWVRTLAPGITHELDLHLELTNSHAFNRGIDPQAIVQHRQALPALGPDAFGPSRTHALLHAAIHRVAHHDRSWRLIWLYDMQLLIEAMDDDEASTLIDVAAQAGLISVLTDGVKAVDHAFGSRATRDLVARLAPHDSLATRELTRRVTRKGAGRLSMFVTDLRALRGLSARVHFIRDNLFPPKAWLRKHFGRTANEPIALPFLRRLGSGLASLRRHSV